MMWLIFLTWGSKSMELEFAKEPGVAAGVHPDGAGLVKARQQAHDGLVGCGLAPSSVYHYRHSAGHEPAALAHPLAGVVP
jgi:hypothetical protein